MANDQKLAGLPEDVREIADLWRSLQIDHAPDGWPAVRMRDLTTMRECAERLARENAELREALHDDSGRIIREWDDERATWKQQADRAEVERDAALIANRDCIDHFEQMRAERDALRKRIADAQTALVEVEPGIGPARPWFCVSQQRSIVRGGDLIGKRVALVPLDDAEQAG